MMPQSESRQNQQAGESQKASTEKKKKSNKKEEPAPKPSDATQNPTKDKTPNKKENKPTSLRRKIKPSLITLPPELRWKIYNYIFQPSYRVAITRQKPKWTPSPTDTRKRLYHTRLPYRNPKTQLNPHDSKHSQVVRRRNPLPISLIFSCKAIYHETILHLYANTQFVFNSTRALDRFLHTTSAQTQEVIQHIELNHVMYNEPRLLRFRVFKHRSDLAWYCACEDLAVACKSLKVLHINMKIWDWPIHLELGERWSWPLLVFERFGNKVDFASVSLQMCKFEEEKLKEMSREVEKRLMRSEAWQVREDERMARGINGKVKANRVLRVVF